jgi:hypothetical protein
MQHGISPVLDDFPGSTLSSSWSQSVDDSTGGAPLPTVTGGTLFGNYINSTSVVWSRERFGADMAVGMHITTKPTANSTNVHMGVRISGATSLNGLNGYQAYLYHFTAGDQLVIGQRDLGVFTAIVQTSTGGVRWAAGDNWEFRVVGTNLELWRHTLGLWSLVLSSVGGATTYTSEGRIEVGGVGTEWKIDDLIASELPVVPLTVGLNQSFLGSTKAGAVTPSPSKTLSAASTVLATLAKAVTKALGINETTFPQVFKSTAHLFPVATAGETATVANPKAQAALTLSASTTTLATAIHGKVVALVAGYNIILPPGFQGVGTNAALTQVRGHASAGNLTTSVTPLGSKTFVLSFRRITSQTTAASLATQFLQQLKFQTVSATQAQVATINKVVTLGIHAFQDQTPVVLAGRPYFVSPAIQTSTASLTHITEQGIPTLLLTPTGPGSLTLVVSVTPDGGLILTPIE